MGVQSIRVMMMMMLISIPSIQNLETILMIARGSEKKEAHPVMVQSPEMETRTEALGALGIGRGIGTETMRTRIGRETRRETMGTRI